MNMKQLRMVILLLTACSILYACPNKDGHYYITIINQSNKTIMFQPRELKIGQLDTLYVCLGGGYIISHDSMYKLDIRGTWEARLNKHSYLQLLFMDRDVHLNYYTQPCDTIRKYVPILHRYQLTLEDLQRMEWTVVYPPE